MNEPIVSIDLINKQAQQAALKYSCINAACPYPFGTTAASLFKAAFNVARAQITKKAPHA